MREATRGEMTRGVNMRRLLHPGVTSRCHIKCHINPLPIAHPVLRRSRASLSQSSLRQNKYSQIWPVPLLTDATLLLHLTSPAANDAALKALLGSAAGKNFRVGPEHFLAKSAGDTAIVVGPDGNDFLVSWPRLDWLILRAVDVTEIAGIKANWLLRPAFSGQ